MHLPQTKIQPQNTLTFHNHNIILESTKLHKIRLYVYLDLTQNLTYAPFIKLSHHKSFSISQIKDFLESNAKWLDSALHKLNQSIIPINSTLQAHKNQIMLFGKWSTPYPKAHLKARLCEFLNDNVALCAKNMDLEFSKISIKESISRFGSCTKDRLSFSLLLVFAPVDEILYVIIHELAHIKHKNHSKDFWNLVALHCPQYKALRQNLKKSALLYRAFLNICKSLNR